MTVSQITKLLAIAAIVFAVLIAAVGIVRLIRRKKENGKTKKLGTVILCVLLAVLCAVNVAVNQFGNIINQVFSSVQVDEVAVEEAAANARAISQRIAEEGIVLLENKNGALPLTEKKVNLFGMASISPVYGGAGSGASDESGNISLIQGIESAGFSVNADLTAFYQERKPKAEDTNIFNLQGGDYNLPEPAVSEYSQALLDSAKQFSDVAIVVFARAGGEGGDLPTDMEKYTGGDPGQHYLKLQTVERAMLDMVIENFGTVIVLINSSNAMELGFLEEEGISAALWIGGPGSTGCAAVGEILAGTVNPSGRLPDIYAYDVTTSPAYWNAGNFYYTNAETGKKTTYKYLEYAEGIYVGYRFYETAAADGYFDYDSTVQYPFGYGLSYTSFSQELVSHKEENGVITCQVKITNTGKTAGKEVAQLYVTAPYTPGGIEKVHVALAAFGKTRLLDAGASETLTLSFRLEDIASYDAQNAGAYVLDGVSFTPKTALQAGATQVASVVFRGNGEFGAFRGIYVEPGFELYAASIRADGTGLSFVTVGTSDKFVIGLTETVGGRYYVAFASNSLDTPKNEWVCVACERSNGDNAVVDLSCETKDSGGHPVPSRFFMIFGTDEHIDLGVAFGSVLPSDN